MSNCILSIDIGVLNLAICCVKKLENLYEIVAWNLINVMETPNLESLTCNYGCKQKAYSTTDGENLCIRHAKKKEKVVMKPKKVKIKNLCVQELVFNLLNALDKLTAENQTIWNLVTAIVIEKQPIENKKMQMVSHIVLGHFVRYFNNSIPISLMPAYHKLNVYNGPVIICNLKTKYAQRKYIGVQQTQWFLQNEVFSNEKWLTIFNNSKKKDDLADSFLQAIFSLKPSYIKQNKRVYKKRKLRY